MNISKNQSPEIYVSTDIEADGPIPGINSMLSFGSAAYLADKTLVSTFSANLETLPGAVSDPKTMEWWRGQPEAWAACRENLKPPETAMKDYLAWLKELPGMPVFVGYPAAYDFLFVYWYLIRFTGESPFSHSALDIKTLAMALMKKPYRQSTKKNMPPEWFDNLPHLHMALDDAVEQGALFCNMLGELRGLYMGQIKSEFEQIVTSFNTLKFLQQIYEQFADFLNKDQKLKLDACFLEYWKLTYAHTSCLGIRRIYKKTRNSISLEKLVEEARKINLSNGDMRDIENKLGEVKVKVDAIKTFVDQHIAHLDSKLDPKQLTMPQIPEALNSIENFLKEFSEKVFKEAMDHFHPTLEHDWLKVFKDLGDHYSRSSSI